MSRVGKKAIEVPKGIDVSVSNNTVMVKGAKGTLTQAMPAGIQVALQEGKVTFQPSGTRLTRQASASWGTARSLVSNMITGVSQGYSIVLNLVGVGYRATAAGSKLNMTLGYSHPIDIHVPQGITLAVKDQTEITISGADKQAVGQFAAIVRGKRAPEPFKGKGVKYANEHIAMKEGKKK